ncbi:MAG: hypothetical protein NTW96_18600 [Planctomycetia bacterium]|nr:hypothetical protein [Planctomycetia bacterium]
MSSTSTAATDTRKFLLALLVDLENDKNFSPPRFRAAHRDLHHFFWQVKQNQQSACFVQDLLFDTNGNFPHCDQIDELLQELQLSGVLSRPNPTYRYHDIGIHESPSAVEFKGSLSPEQMKSYEQVVKDFKRELGVRATS